METPAFILAFATYRERLTTGSEGPDAAAWTLLACFFGVMLLVAVFTLLIVREVRKQNAATFAPSGEPSEGILPQPISRAWLAVRSTDLQAVQSALHLQHTQTCLWSEGKAQLEDHDFVLSPPVDGWILVFGPGLIDPQDDVDACFLFLNRLSRELGEVQYFSFHRVLNHHSWVKALSGRIVRGYAFAGTVLWNQGEPTAAERELKMELFQYGDESMRKLYNQQPQSANNAEKVIRLAALWSLDPGVLENSELATAKGLTGKQASSRPR